MSELIITVASAVVITVLMCVSGTLLILRKHNENRPKASTKNAVDDGIKQMQDVYTQMITDLKQQNKTLQASVNRYKGLVSQDDEEETPEENILQNPLLQAAAQKYGIDAALLNTPEAQKFIKKNKDMIPIVLSFLAKRGDSNQPNFGTQGFGNMPSV